MPDPHETCMRCGAQFNQIEYDLQRHRCLDISKLHDKELIQIIIKAINNGLSDYEDGEIIEAGNYFERAQIYLAGFQERIKMEIKRELDAGGDPGELDR